MFLQGALNDIRTPKRPDIVHRGCVPCGNIRNSIKEGLHMRETVKTRIQLKAMVLTIATMMTFMLVFGLTTIISHAEDARVTASSVKIREGADTGTTMIGGALQGEILPITGETVGADGYTWYQVTFAIDGTTKTGYVRSDLVEKVSGGTATTTTPTTPTTTNPTTPASTPSTEVVAIVPISAKVTGEAVRVRSNASTSGSIVDTVRKDVVLTVVGTAQDSAGYTWYQVNFTNASGQVAGFVRNDFVTLEGEIVPADQVPAEPDPPEVTDPVEPVATPEPVRKDYETQLYEDGWNLLDYTVEGGRRYVISELFGSIDKYKQEAADSEAKLKSTKIIMIILVVAVILLALTATLLFFKIRDMMDAAYFEEVEKETVRKRQGQRSTGKGSMPTVGDGKSAGGGQARSSGSSQARPAGSGQRSAGNGKPRPAGSGQQGRPAGNGQARPAGSGQARPSGNSQSRPAGSGQQAKPAGGQARPAQQTAKPAARQQERPISREGQNASGQPKNFLADDDEFDFEYLNWDGEEEN